MAKICCIIVTYNRKKYLIKELDALIHQSYPIEGFIIINNDSPDDTFDYLELMRLLILYIMVKKYIIINHHQT